MTQKTRLSDHVTAEAMPHEIDRQWAAVDARLSHGPRRPRWLPLSLLLAGATAMAIAYVSADRVPVPSHWTSQSAPLRFTLTDGSQMQLEPRSEVGLSGEREGEVRLQVVRGAVRFEIRPDPARRFQVSAAGIDVVVTGTAFTVELEGSQGGPHVSVERGTVEVRVHHEGRLLARLHAGETWPPRLAPSEVPAEAAPAAPAAPAAELEAPSTGADTVAAPAASASGRAPAPTDSRRLLEQANAARRSGDFAQAAALLETLRVRYPRDPRAALASFELGRLRMDALGDLAGAVQALKQSIALAPTGVFREDAEACLATAYARLHDRPRCESARRAYLDRHPEGMHAAALAALDCGTRR
jgi:transmembrane sensor